MTARLWIGLLAASSCATPGWSQDSETGEKPNDLPIKIVAEDVPLDRQRQFAEFFIAQFSVKLVPLDGPAVAGVLDGEFYKATSEQKDGNGYSEGYQTVVYDGKQFTPLPLTDTAKPLPGLLSVIAPKFRLRSDADAKKFEAALDKLYPIDDFGTSVKAIKHAGNQWTFVRAPFVEKRLAGFVLTTDDEGKVTKVAYSLSIE